MRPQVPTDASEPGALFLNYFYRIKAPTSIIASLFEIGEPFPIEWCQELPPSDRSFGYRGLSRVARREKMNRWMNGRACSLLSTEHCPI